MRIPSKNNRDKSGFTLRIITLCQFIKQSAKNGQLAESDNRLHSEFKKYRRDMI